MKTQVNQHRGLVHPRCLRLKQRESLAGYCPAETALANFSAAAVAILTSLSLLRPATPTAPTTSFPARRGTPPRSDTKPAVTNAGRPLFVLFSISAVGSC